MKTRAFAVLAAAMAATTVCAEQPDKFVRYVEATGTQFVDTGVTGRYNTRIEMQLEWMNIAEQMLLGCGDWSNNTRFYACYCANNDGNIATGQGSYEKVDYYYSKENNHWNSWWEKGRIYDYSIEFTAKDGDGNSTRKISVDGIRFADVTTAAVDTGINLYLFAHNRGSEYSYYSKARIYRMKIWQGTTEGGEQTLARDFIPCMKNNCAGLYDTVSGEIFFSTSNTDLVCDENSNTPDEFVEYVESTGLNYIDTEVIARSGTSAEIDFAILDKTNRRRCILGAEATEYGANSLYLVHAYDHTVSYGYGGIRKTAQRYEVGDRCHITTSLAVGSQTMTCAVNGGEPATISSTNDNASVDAKVPLYLFACNAAGAPARQEQSRVYSLKISQDGVLVRNFKPCLKNGAFALYDEVSGRIFYPRRGLLNGPVRQSSVKAKDVIFVKYIESDGTQTLDTGVRARAGTRAKGEFAWTTTLRELRYEVPRFLEEPVGQHAHAYLGADDPAEWPTFFYMVYAEDQCLAGYYGNGLGNNSVAYSGWAYKDGNKINISAAGTKHSFDASFMKGEQTLEFDGTQVWSLSNDSNFDTGKNLHIFSSGSRYRSAARCYGLEIWQDGEKVRDFKPCIYDGKAMLYDMVTQSVFRPSPDISEEKAGGIVLTGEERPANYVDYVESDGTFFIDTGIVGKSGTKGESKFKVLERGDTGIVGARNDSLGNDYSRFYLFHNYTPGSNNSMGYGYGKYQTIMTAYVATEYEVQSSLLVNAQTVSVNGSQKINNAESKEINTGLNLYLFALNYNGPSAPSKTRIYYLKMWQGDADGSNMRLVRNYKPVKLKNGLVALWDFVEKKAYLPQSITSPYEYKLFPSNCVGPDGDKIVTGMQLIVR